MSTKPKGSKILNFGIHSPDGGGKPLDFSLQANEISYYEDVMDATVHMTISIIDVYGRFNKLPVRSGNKVFIEVENDGKVLRFDDETEPLYISNIIGYTSEAKREGYTLVLETKTAFNNHITRVFEKYKGKLSSTVSKILKEKLEVPDDRMSIEETSNDYTFCAGYRRPLHCCTWLSTKAMSAGNSDTAGSAGFLFFQTREGYILRDVDKLFTEVLEKKDEAVKYIYQIDKSSVDANKNTYTFSNQPIMGNSHDIMEQLRNGQFKTANHYYNIVTKKPEFKEYSYEKSIGKQMTLSAEIENVPKDFKEKYSRMILSPVDYGCLDSKGELSVNKDSSPNEMYAQASARFSSLYAQSIQITVPLNIDVTAGMALYLKLPELNKTTTDGPASGFYLVSHVSHRFGGDGDATGIILVRDSYIDLS
tara:strand:- start:140 stop:1402 length:1263 start_codon:yes stop_codon:yes gene_type:complete